MAQTGATAVFIDEIHWDNVGLDFGEVSCELISPVALLEVGDRKLELLLPSHQVLFRFEAANLSPSISALCDQ